MKSEKQNIELKVMGKYGEGYIAKIPGGERRITINWINGEDTIVNSLEVNLGNYKYKSLNYALEQACHNAQMLNLFQKRVIKGPKAIVTLFQDPKKEDKGYVTIAKKGTEQLRFALNRIDLKKMNEKTIISALQKVAFVTGKVSIR
jgi:hypothetical protein